LPRIRDFRGISTKNIDQCGNLSIGFKEHIVFPEIRSDEVERIHGLQINITTDAGSQEVGEELFRLLGLRLQKKD
jgi:large subunit ribosomal protein L5